MRIFCKTKKKLRNSQRGKKNLYGSNQNNVRANDPKTLKSRHEITYILIFCAVEWSSRMQNSLLCVVKHFRDVLEGFGGAFYATLHLRISLHDGENLLKIGNLTIHPARDYIRPCKGELTSMVEKSTRSTLLPTSTTGFFWSIGILSRIRGSQWEEMRSIVVSSSTE